MARHLSVYGLGQTINPKRLETTYSATEEDPGAGLMAESLLWTTLPASLKKNLSK